MDTNDTVINGLEKNKATESETSFGERLGKVAAGFAGGILLGGIATVGVAVLTSSAVKENDEESKKPEPKPEPVSNNAVAEPHAVADPSAVVDSSMVAEQNVAIETVADFQQPVSEPEIQENPVWVDDSVEIATVVDDGMSFAEAFRQARAEVGSGGAFEWRGNVYSTFTAEEWDDMSAEQKQEYNDHFDWSRYSTEYQPEPEPESEPELDPEPSFLDSESEVQFLGLDFDSENGAIIGEIAIGGNDVLLIDLDPVADGDNHFDVLTLDLDGDGRISSDEVLDISDNSFRVDEFALHVNKSVDSFDAADDDFFNDGEDMYI